MQNEGNGLEIALLQLQRSALIDTQTIMQILVDKEICTLTELAETRAKIEKESPDVDRIDEQIQSLGGTVKLTPIPEVIADKQELRNQLNQLKQLLQQVAEEESK